VKISAKSKRITSDRFPCVKKLIGEQNFWEKLIDYYILIRTFMMSLSFKQKKISDKSDFKIEF
jgi:hypothetical protein